MRAAGVELNLDERGGIDAGESAPVGASFASGAQRGAAPGLGNGGHARAMYWVAADRKIDPAARIRQKTLYQSDVGFFHRAPAKGFAEFGVGGVGFCHKDHAGCSLLEAMDDPRTQQIAPLRDGWAPPKQC